MFVLRGAADNFVVDIQERNDSTYATGGRLALRRLLSVVRLLSLKTEVRLLRLKA